MQMFLIGEAVDSVRFQATIPASFLQAVVLTSVLFSKPLQYIWIFPIMCITQQPICDLHGGLSYILVFRVCGLLLNVKPVDVQRRGELGVYKQLFTFYYAHGVFQIPGTPPLLSFGWKPQSSFHLFHCGACFLQLLEASDRKTREKLRLVQFLQSVRMVPFPQSFRLLLALLLPLLQLSPQDCLGIGSWGMRNRKKKRFPLLLLSNQETPFPLLGQRQRAFPRAFSLSAVPNSHFLGFRFH